MYARYDLLRNSPKKTSIDSTIAFDASVPSLKLYVVVGKQNSKTTTMLIAPPHLPDHLVPGNNRELGSHGTDNGEHVRVAYATSLQGTKTRRIQTFDGQRTRNAAFVCFFSDQCVMFSVII